jgi:hypothetical protein
MIWFCKPALKIFCDYTAMHNKHEYFEQHGNITVSFNGSQHIKQLKKSESSILDFFYSGELVDVCICDLQFAIHIVYLFG